MCFGSYITQTFVLLIVSTLCVQNTTQLFNWTSGNEDLSHSGVIRSRVPRYIVFPKKSNVVLSLVLLKSTNVGRGLNTLHEVDFFFPLPTRHVYLHRQQKSMQRQIMDAFTLFGLNGTSCLGRTLCEIGTINNRLKQLNVTEDLSQELLTILLGEMDSYIDLENKNQCKYFTKVCSVSLLDLWHHFFDTVMDYLESHRLRPIS